MRSVADWFRVGHSNLPPADRYLLSMFLKPRAVATITNGGWADQWRAVLHEDPASVIDRLARAGHLTCASVLQVLAVLHTVDSLQDALRDRGLKVSGRKQDLLDRLVEADPKWSAAEADNQHVLVCSKAGAMIGERYVREREDRRETAMRAASDCLRQRRIAEAASVMRKLNEGEVSLPEIGLGVGAKEIHHRETLGHLFRVGLPRIVGQLSANVTEKFLVAAGMALLGVENAHKRFLPDGFQSYSHLSDEVAVRMSTFAALHRRRMAQYREIDVTHVKISTVVDCCAACRALSGAQFSLDDAPELPYPLCTCEAGCRCQEVPILD